MQNQSDIVSNRWPQRLRPYQLEARGAILESVRSKQGLSFSVQMARQAGKNELSAQIEALLLLINSSQNVEAVKCAPTFDPQCRISLRRLWSRLSEAGLSPIASIEAGHVIRVGHARQLFLSAEPEANVAGHTAGLLLEVDEAQDVDEEKFDRDFRPMASAANATVVYYGTAWDDSTLLERAKQRHLELERRDGIRRHFEYDWQIVAPQPRLSPLRRVRTPTPRRAASPVCHAVRPQDDLRRRPVAHARPARAATGQPRASACARGRRNLHRRPRPRRRRDR